MVRKMQPGAAASDGAGDAKGDEKLAGTVRESAGQIWLAGLGAFAKAQEEGGKVFEALVKEGLSLQRKTQAAAEEKLSEATTRMASMASDISSRASGQWDKLETIFEQRVSRAMNRLGAPSASDMETLMARIDELQRSVERLAAERRSPVKAPKATRTGNGAARPAARRTARKSAE